MMDSKAFAFKGLSWSLPPALFLLCLFCFIVFVLGSPIVVIRAYSSFCAQGSLIGIFGEFYWVLGIGPRSVKCSTHSTIILVPLPPFFLFLYWRTAMNIIFLFVFILGHTQQCSGVGYSWLYTQESLQVVLWEQYGILRIEHRFTAHKLSALPNELWPQLRTF